MYSQSPSKAHAKTLQDSSKVLSWHKMRPTQGWRTSPPACMLGLLLGLLWAQLELEQTTLLMPHRSEQECASSLRWTQCTIMVRSDLPEAPASALAITASVMLEIAEPGRASQTMVTQQCMRMKPFHRDWRGLWACLQAP